MSDSDIMGSYGGVASVAETRLVPVGTWDTMIIFLHVKGMRLRERTFLVIGIVLS